MLATNDRNGLGLVRMVLKGDDMFGGFEQERVCVAVALLAGWQLEGRCRQ